MAYNSEGSVVENCFADVSGQQGLNGLFGTNLGETINCTEFVPYIYMGDGVLSEPVVIGETQTDRLVEALNAWVNAQEEPNLYREWIEGLTIYVPQFGEFWDDIADNESLSSVFVYPNPVIDRVVIEGVEAAEVEVYNAIGQRVKTVRSTNEIPVEDLSQGVYLLRIADAEGRKHVVRVAVKE